MGGVLKRRIEVGTDTCLLGFSGRDYIKSHAFDASTLAPTGGVSEVQTVTLTGTPGSGTFTLKYRGQETATIAYNAIGSTVQTALRALANVGATGVTVTGGAGGPYVVTFAGPLANTDVFMLSLGTNALGGGTAPSLTVAQTTQGVTYDPRIMVGSSLYPGTIVTEVSGSSPKKVKEYTNAGGVAEVQTLTTTGTPTGGTFRLSYKGNETTDLNHSATAANVAAALNALDSISEEGGVTATGGALPGTPVVVTFAVKGARPALTMSTNAMTGGTTPVVASAETTAGVDGETIYGVIDGTEEFMAAVVEASRDVAVYKTQCVFDGRKIKNYATYAAEFQAWCAAKFNSVEHV